MTTIVLPSDASGDIINALWTLDFTVKQGSKGDFYVTLPPGAQILPNSHDLDAKTIYTREGKPLFDFRYEREAEGTVKRIAKR